MRTDRLRTAVSAAALILLATAAALHGCGGGSGQENAAYTPPPVNVEVTAVSPVPFTETLQLTGIIKAEEDVLLSPEEGGALKQWRYRKGDMVSRGAVVAVLNDEVARASYEAALQAMGRHGHDVYLVDYRLGARSGLELNVAVSTVFSPLSP